MAYLLLQAILDYPFVCIVLLLLGYIVGAASSGTKQWSPRAALASLRSWRGRAGDGAGLGAAGADALTTPSAQPPPGEAAPQEEPDDGISSSPWWGVDLEAAGQLVERMTRHDAGTEAGWKHMMDKETPGVFKYSAYRRALPSGLTEYRTVTTAPNTSPLELMEFLLDDDARRGWEGFLAKATVLQQGAWPAREQVVRWVRRFPFHFLTDREYVIARKAWCMGPGNRLRPVNATTPGAPLYAITMGLDEHPAAPRTHALVRTSGFLSQWRCAAVPDPWGGPNPAAEVVLLHREDIHVPEYLARTAVSMGMSKFVKELVGGLQGFTQARRGRGIGPHAADPLAYGHDFARTMSMLPSTSLHVGTGPKRNRDEEALPATADFETMGHMHPAASQPAGAGAGAQAALCDGAGISAAESLHTHPHRRRYRHRLHRLLGRPSPKPHTAAATSPAATAAAPTAAAITSLPKGAILLPNTGALTPSPPGSVASSGNASPLASSGAVTPLAVSPGVGSPAAAITAVATPAGWVVTPVTTTGGPLPSTPPSSPFAAAGVAAGAALREASQKVGAGTDGLLPCNLPWQRKLVVGVVSAAVLAGVRQLLQQQHRAVVGRAGPALPGKSSRNHRKGHVASAAAAPAVAAPDAAADAIVPSAVVKEVAAPAAEVAAEVVPVPSARAGPSVTASEAVADAVADGITPGGASHVKEDVEAAGGSSRAGRAKAGHSHYPKSFRLMDAEGQAEWGNLLGSASSSEGK